MIDAITRLTLISLAVCAPDPEVAPRAEANWPILGPEAVIATEQSVIAAIRQDLLARQECDRRYFRYFVLRHTFPGVNPSKRFGDGDSCIEAVSLLLKSLTFAPYRYRTSQLTAVQVRGALLIPFDLRMYSWNPGKWDAILAGAYPYGVIDSGNSWNEITSMTQSRLPYVRADWFVFAASRPPLYHELLGIPATQVELEMMLGVNVKENYRLGEAHRCGFRKSNVSRFNRLVEFHLTRFGQIWISYDFGGNSGQRDLLSHPLGPACGEGDTRSFRHDGGEIVFTLPNGMLGYMLVDGVGNRIDSAPIGIVADTTAGAGTPQIVNGVSCMGCHIEGQGNRVLIARKSSE